ncbi:MAG: ATP synthase F1 subunit gamma [bacterium]|nr:ATP synthase F1 subunit gamma [bacterium]
MSVSPRLIRRRIRSVQNTKKITKAMEMVAAAKMRRAVAAALKSRAYAKLAWRMIATLEGTVAEEIHPLLRAPIGVTQRQLGGEGSLYIVMASDRGLCGGFNAALFREVRRDVQERKETNVRFVAVGKKAEQFIRRQGWTLDASFTDIGAAPSIAALRPVAKIAMETFMREEVHRVRIAFTDFISSLRQQPTVRTLLPLRRFTELETYSSSRQLDDSPSVRRDDDPSSARHFDDPGKEKSHTTHNAQTVQEFLFEPNPKAVLDTMLPRLVELQVYQAYLDAGASEHSARMLAMRSASDAATDMIYSLTLSFNRARQAMITQEIAEISAGSAALA